MGLLDMMGSLLHRKAVAVHSLHLAIASDKSVTGVRRLPMVGADLLVDGNDMPMDGEGVPMDGDVLQVVCHTLPMVAGAWSMAVHAMSKPRDDLRCIGIH